MSTNIVSKLLIILGSITLFFALNMDVAFEGSTVVNLQMMSDRQNTLIIGGIFFIAGIILFSLTKLKQTDEEAALEKAKIDDRAKNIKAVIDSAFDKSSQSTNLIFTIFQRLRPFFVDKSECAGSIITRLTLSFIFATLTALVAFVSGHIENYVIYGNFYVFFMALYSLRAKPLLDVLNHIVFISLILNTLMLIDNPPDIIGWVIFAGIPAAGLITLYFIKKIRNIL